MSCVIYRIGPGIGVARVGNSPEGFYIGPETAGGLPLPADDPSRPFTPEDLRDAEGRMNRQAARFTIFRVDPDGTQAEVTLESDGVEAIVWTVHLANKKASWYTFSTNKGEQGYGPTHPLRNEWAATKEQRQALVIDPGPRRISGRDQGPVPCSRDTIPAGYDGRFPPPTLNAGLGTTTRIDTLGDLRTDAQGRLLVLGGHGRSGSTQAEPQLPEYANNDHWFDDTSDGPVTATIRFTDGTTAQAENGWVLVGPPGYAPQIFNLVTLYDTIFDAAVRTMGARPDIYEDALWKRGADGYQPDFQTQIKPIIMRGEGYPWVVAIPPKPHHFDYDMLGSKAGDFAGYRQYILDVLRAPTEVNVLLSPATGATMMPYLAGDDAIGSVTETQSKYLSLTDTQYFMLQQWADGHFVDQAPASGDRWMALTQAVLENCVGGAFSPGIEMTWISRNPAIYAAPFQIKLRPVGHGPLSLGQDFALGLEPGDVTKYMAIPWQADFNECSVQTIGDRYVWWWPAQRPLFVYVPRPSGEGGGPPDPPLAQVPWIGSDWNQNASDYVGFSDNLQMVAHWHELGFVLDEGSPGRPRFVQVERTLKDPQYSVNED